MVIRATAHGAHNGVVRSLSVETPRGPAEVQITDPAGPPVSQLFLGHGAGGGVHAPDLTRVHDAAVAAGVRVALVTQPYRVAGRKAPAPAPPPRRGLDGGGRRAWPTPPSRSCWVAGPAERGSPAVRPGR